MEGLPGSRVFTERHDGEVTEEDKDGPDEVGKRHNHRIGRETRFTVMHSHKTNTVE